MLGEIFARRIQDGAPAEQIDDAWKSYVNAVVEWNSDMMINIVGMEQYYTEKKSTELELIILPKFVEFDTAVRSLYLSRLGKTPPVETADSRRRTVFELGTDLRDILYVFVRCFRRGQEDSKRAGCSLS